VVRNLGVVLALLVLTVACDSGEERLPAHIVVSADGSIGKLHVDQSDRDAVIAFVGKPEAERHSVERGSSAPYDALGYDCRSRLSRQTFPLVSYPYHPPYCRTIFWIDVKSGKLENFFTSDSHYVEAHGVGIGMPTRSAERLLHRRLFAGCEDNFYLPSATHRTLTIAFTGGVVRRPRRSLHVVGGHVFALVLHSRLRDANVFDCL
jgi:hypothetical protein